MYQQHYCSHKYVKDTCLAKKTTVFYFSKYPPPDYSNSPIIVVSNHSDPPSEYSHPPPPFIWYSRVCFCYLFMCVITIFPYSDHPTTIKQRFNGVLLVSLISPVLVFIWSNNADANSMVYFHFLYFFYHRAQTFGS